MTKYPLHEELKSRETERAAVQSFINWMVQEKGWRICSEDDDQEFDRFHPIMRPWGDVIGEFMGIDPNALEAEKQQMLDEIRKDMEDA